MCVRVCCMCVRAQLVLSTFQILYIQKKKKNLRRKKNKTGKNALFQQYSIWTRLPLPCQHYKIYCCTTYGGCVALWCDPMSRLAYTGCTGFWPDLPAPPLAYAGFNSVEVMSVYLFVSVCYRWLSLCAVKKIKITSALVWDHSNFTREKNNTRKDKMRKKRGEKRNPFLQISVCLLNLLSPPPHPCATVCVCWILWCSRSLFITVQKEYKTY